LHDLIDVTKSRIAGNYLKSGNYSSKQLAEGIMQSMDFAHKAHRHKEMQLGKTNTRVDSVMQKDLDVVHNKYEEEIKAHWTKPTPDEEEIARELAEGEFEAYQQKMTDELIAQTVGILKFIKANERTD